MIVGSTDRISTRRVPAFAANDVTASAITAIKGTFGRRICWISTLSPPGEAQFLPDALEERERYFQGPRNAILNLRRSVFGFRADGSRATGSSSADAAIAVDYRVNFARSRQHFWRSSLL